MNRDNRGGRSCAVRRWTPLIGLALAVAGSTGCTRYTALDAGRQAYYRTGAPVHDTSEDLERILASTRRINVTGAYRTYVFAEETAPTAAELTDPAVFGRAADTVSVSRTRAATAVVVSRSGRRVLLITAHHAVHFPDTIVDHFGRPRDAVGEAAGRRVRSVAVKTRQTNWVIGREDLLDFEILAVDDRNDIALIGVRDTERERAPVLPVRPGDARRLAWGSFVYVLGYPAGYALVTRGIASPQPAAGPGAFVVDGLWNEGMSGGVILGIRGQGGDLEWIGMVRAAAGQVEPRLVPTEEAAEHHEPGVPYLGPVFVEQTRRIRYGIMLPVPITEIRRFVDRYRTELRRRGYEPPRF